MFPLHRLTRPVAALALGCALLGRLQAADATTFVNPFTPAAAAGGPAQANGTPDAPLELRGIMVEGDSTMFSIYDPSRHAATWTKLNELGRDYIVRTYDAAKDTVTLDYQGRTLTLVLHTAKIASAPVSPMPMMGASPPPAMPQPIGGPVVLNPTPADEQRRLEAIAAEVNRRRMIRQQALQASRQQIQPAPPGNQPPPGNPPQPR